MITKLDDLIRYAHNEKIDVRVTITEDHLIGGWYSPLMRAINVVAFDEPMAVMILAHELGHMKTANSRKLSAVNWAFNTTPVNRLSKDLLERVIAYEVLAWRWAMTVVPVDIKFAQNCLRSYTSLRTNYGTHV